MSAENRKDLLDAAAECVTVDRNSTYGEPENNFRDIADIWSAQLSHKLVDGEHLTPADVAMLMIGMKLARLKHNPGHRDSWVDAIGYAACGGDVSSTQHQFPHLEEDESDLSVAITKRINPSGASLLDWLDAVNKKIDSLMLSGWVSENRCGKAGKPHPGHHYGNAHFDAPMGSYWCDGWQNPSAKSASVKHNGVKYD